MDTPLFSLAMKKYRRMIVLLCLSASVTSALITYLIPEKYEATTLVLVRPQENIKISGHPNDKELLNFPVGGGVVKAETPSNTYIEVLKSRTIGEKVVRRLHLDQERIITAETYYKEVVAFLKKKGREYLLAAKQILKYGRYLGPSPPFEKAVDEYQKNISLRAIKDTYLFEIDYMAEDPAESAAAANAAAELFIAHMAAMNVEEAKRTLDFVGARLENGKRDLLEARAAAREFKLKSKTVAFKEETSEAIKLIAALETDLEKTEVKLAGLLIKFTRSHPYVQSLQAEKDRLLSTLNQRKAALSRLPETERQLATLELNIQVAKDLYEVLEKEHEQARIHEGLKRSDMRVASEAVAPLYPTKPIKIYYIGASFCIALFLGAGFALLRESTNTTIQSVVQAETSLQLRVLTTLPNMRSARPPI